MSTMTTPDPPTTDRHEADTRDGAPGRAGERLFYRDDDEFNTALDKATETIIKAEGPPVFRNVAWLALIGVQAFLYLSDWVLHWDVREGLVPGVDLVKPMWILIGIAAVIDHAWTRNRHGRIIRNRLCFTCAKSLLDVPLDAAGGGRCPACDRPYNVGEYRRPRENRGREFQGYIDGDHFDRTMYAAAERIHRARGGGLQADLLTWAWVALGVCFGLSLLAGWDPLDWIPGPQPNYAVASGILGVWSLVHWLRTRRFRPRVIERRLCLDCGYSLLHTPCDENEIGRCPECGELFSVAQYQRPPDEPEETKR
ncbi:MAG: hypothetical protein GY715_16560 [Planctomycetes bacterium]|nr:hypothetical protein [Planctomycetota bacterium]